MLNFLHTFNPQPILFQLGLFKVHWYGLLIVLGIILGFLVTLKLAKRADLSSENVFNLFFYLIIFGLLGARIYEILFINPLYFFAHPLEMVQVWHGGLAIHGGVIAGLGVIYFYTKKHQLSFWRVADLLAPGLVLAQAIGRWGNYFNQELFGWPTNVSWGIPIALINRPWQFIPSEFFHPTFLYQSLANFVIFLILFLLVRRSLGEGGFIRKKKSNGSIFLLYLILYSTSRLVIEFWRIDPTPLIFGLRWPQVVSVLLIIGAIIVWLIRRQKVPSREGI